MKKLIAIITCIISFAACTIDGTSVPVTGTERYVQADGAYKALLVTVQGAVNNGTLKGEAAQNVKSALGAARVALDAWHIVPNDPNAEQAALVALQAARTLLQSIAPKPQTWIYENIYDGAMA